MRVPTENLALTTLDRTTIARKSRLSTPVQRLRVRSASVPHRVLIVGTCMNAQQLAHDLQADCAAQRCPLLPLGFVYSHGAPRTTGKSLPVLGGMDDLPALVKSRKVDLVLVADAEHIARIVAMGLPEHVRVAHAPHYCETSWRKVPSYLLEAAWFDIERGFRLLNRPIDDAAKRVFDFIAAAFLLVALSPVYAIVALAVILDNPGPVFYHQKRTGLGGVPFYVHKFRSMRTDAEKFGAQWATENDPRITRVGHFLRLTRLDELPQFWNVLCGQMSLIGPRPERPEFDVRLAQEIPHYDARYRVRPGISGWAQVCYRYGASVDDARQKLAYDLYYIKHGSALLDAIILLRTVQVVFLKKGR